MRYLYNTRYFDFKLKMINKIKSICKIFFLLLLVLQHQQHGY